MENKKAEALRGLQFGVGLPLILHLRFHPVPLSPHRHTHTHTTASDSEILMNNVATAAPPTTSNTAHQPPG